MYIDLSENPNRNTAHKSVPIYTYSYNSTISTTSSLVQSR